MAPENNTSNILLPSSEQGGPGAADALAPHGLRKNPCRRAGRIARTVRYTWGIGVGWWSPIYSYRRLQI